MCVLSLIFHHSLQAKELQTLHNLRKLFVQDLATRVKKVKKNNLLFYVYIVYSFGNLYVLVLV